MSNEVNEHLGLQLCHHRGPLRRLYRRFCSRCKQEWHHRRTQVIDGNPDLLQLVKRRDDLEKQKRQAYAHWQLLVVMAKQATYDFEKLGGDLVPDFNDVWGGAGPDFVPAPA